MLTSQQAALLLTISWQKKIWKRQNCDLILNTEIFFISTITNRLLPHTVYFKWAFSSTKISSQNFCFVVHFCFCSFTNQTWTCLFLSLLLYFWNWKLQWFQAFMLTENHVVGNCSFFKKKMHASRVDVLHTNVHVSKYEYDLQSINVLSFLGN